MMGKKRFNDLDGKTWARYSISVWSIAKTPEEMKLGHQAMFPLKLCEQLIEIYTRIGDVVLDPFMGSGAVIVAAKKLGRKGIGFDVVKDFVDLAKQRILKQRVQLPIQRTRLTEYEREKAQLPSAKRMLKSVDIEPEVYCEDARNLLRYVKPESIDLCITSPPYWMVHKRKRTADYKESRPYSELESDLGNIPDYGEFMHELRGIFQKVHRVLKPGKRCIIVVMDIRVKDKFIPFHMDIIRVMQNIEFVLEDIIIWDRRLEYSNLRPLGYPYKFIVNKVHEYILIFRKER